MSKSPKLTWTIFERGPNNKRGVKIQAHRCELNPNGHLVFFVTDETGEHEDIVYVQATGTFTTCELQAS